jgi:DNA-binding MarR family transcriptional regulator/GNAT superfamily N-acetyltransferase
MGMRAEYIDAVRRFNRFYTRQIGALNAGFLGSPFSLTQVRVLYELAHRDRISASDLTRDLGIDPGYVSRILVAFEKSGLVRRKISRADARRVELSLTARGSRLFRELDERQRDEVRKMLSRVPAKEQRDVVHHIQSVEHTLSRSQLEDLKPALRHELRPGDIGCVIHRQAVLYQEEYGWDHTYEALVAEVLAKFVRNFDAVKERCWIAERGGEIVGTIFCVKKSAQVAQLRLLYVEPSVRGSGLGTQLVEECINFARQAGYRRLTLWTNSVLKSARGIYERTGFHLVARQRHRSFGQNLIGETWDLDL